MVTGDINAPESHEAGRFGGTNPRDTGQEGDRRNRSPRLGGLREKLGDRVGREQPSGPENKAEAARRRLLQLLAAQGRPGIIAGPDLGLSGLLRRASLTVG